MDHRHLDGRGIVLLGGGIGCSGSDVMSVSPPSLPAGVPRFSSQPEVASVRHGDSQVLTCDVNLDLARFTRWERDRQPLQLSPRVLQLPGAALVVSTATEADVGRYRCVLENLGPSKASEEVELQVVPGEYGWPVSGPAQNQGPVQFAGRRGVWTPICMR